MKKILFGITNLSVGGAEKVLIEIVNKISDKYSIEIFTLYGNGELEKLLNKNIKINSLYNKSYDKFSKIKRTFISVKLLLFKKYIYKKYINKNYDVEIAFLEGPVTYLLSVKNKNTKKIAWIHTDISLIFGNNLKSKIKKILNKKIYSKYQKLIFVSENNLNIFNKQYNISIEKEVIHNYLNKNNILKKSKEFNPNFPNDNILNFVTVCRLVEPKAIHRLAKIHKKLLENGYNHRFYVVGDGPLKKELENFINYLNVSNTFILLGQNLNPYPYILNADYFCLLSYYEGLPMVLLEAKLLNKYILITNNSSKEAISDYENKKIFENNEKDIYDGLKNLIINGKNIQIKKYEFQNKNDEIINRIINIIGE